MNDQLDRYVIGVSPDGAIIGGNLTYTLVFPGSRVRSSRSAPARSAAAPLNVSRTGNEATRHRAFASTVLDNANKHSKAKLYQHK